MTKFISESTQNKPKYSDNKNDQEYQVQKSGRTISYLTTGQEDFKSASEIVQSDSDPKDILLLRKGNCKRCNLELETLPEGCYPLGIPIRVVRRGNTYIFKTVKKFCSFECAYGELLDSVYRGFGDHISEDFIQWLRFMFHLIYPDRELVASPEGILRKANGGSLSDDEYYSGTNYYCPTSNIIHLPTKQEYITFDLSDRNGIKH
jgi:hypothetical protein